VSSNELTHRLLQIILSVQGAERSLTARLNIISQSPTGASMKIDSRIIGDIHFLDCRGQITLGEGTMKIRTTVADILKGGGNKIVLNLAEVNYIDSSGVGELVSTYTTVARQGGHLKLLSLTKKVHEVLEITKLLTVFQTYDSEPTAVASFA
jgi:anti-sigma B factor antagonist